MRTCPASPRSTSNVPAVRAVRTCAFASGVSLLVACSSAGNLQGGDASSESGAVRTDAACPSCGPRPDGTIADGPRTDALGPKDAVQTDVGPGSKEASATSPTCADGGATSAFCIDSPAEGATVAGAVSVVGTAGSEWVDVAGYDLNDNMNKVGADVTVASGHFSLVLDTTKVANGAARIAVVAFSVPAGNPGGGAYSRSEIDLELVVDNGTDAGGTQDAGSGTGVLARPVSAFLDSLGVNIHDDQDNSDSYATEFQFTRIRNARAAPLRSSPQKTLHQASVVTGSYPGVSFELVTYSGTSVATQLADARNLQAAGILIAIEGPNEPNNEPFSYDGAMGGGSSSWLPVAQFQKDLYAAVKADAVLGTAGANIPVYDTTEVGAETDNVGLQFLTIPAGSNLALPDGTKFADYANCHNYIQPGDNNAWNGASPNAPAPSDGMYGEYFKTWSKGYLGYPAGSDVPRVTTETGWYSTTGDGTSPTTEAGQGLQVLNLYLAQFARGWDKTFIYELFDSDGGNASFGMYHADRTPKPAATYVHNLTSILVDLGTITPGRLPYTIPNEPATCHDLLLQNSNGKFYLVVWNERVAGSDAVTVDLGGTHASVQVFDPTSGTAPVQTLTNASAVSLTADDRPFILAID